MFSGPDASGKLCLENMVPVPHAIDDFRNGFRLDIFKKMWIKLLK